MTPDWINNHVVLASQCGGQSPLLSGLLVLDVLRAEYGDKIRLLMTDTDTVRMVQDSQIRMTPNSPQHLFYFTNDSEAIDNNFSITFIYWLNMGILSTRKFNKWSDRNPSMMNFLKLSPSKSTSLK